MSYLKSLGKIRLAILCLILCNVIWGAAYPIYKWTLEVIPPFTFVFLRFYLGALVLLPFTYKNLSVKSSDWKSLFIISFLGITVTISFLILGLRLTSSINAPIIQSSAPVFLIIGSFLYLKEKLKTKTVFGTIVSLTGVLIIVLMPVFNKGGVDGNILGNLFLILASIGSVVYALLLKKILPSYSVSTIAFWAFFLGSLPLVPFYFIELHSTQWILNLNLGVLIGILFSAIFATSVAHTLYAFGIKNIKASEVGIFTYVDPIATIIVAIPLLGEKITVPYVLGALLVFGGIFVAQGRIHYHPIHRLFGKS